MQPRPASEHDQGVGKGRWIMTLRRYLLPAALLFTVLVVCAAGLAAQSYPDRTGDVKGGAGPDIGSVTISHSASTITFRIRFAAAPPLRVSTRGGWVDMLLLGIDVPPYGPLPVSPGGEWRGADFALGAHGPSKTGLLVRLAHARSHVVVRFPIATSGRTLSFSIPRSALGYPARFAFTVAAAREGENETTGGGVDVAPERGTYRYVLSR
jgi:hypothetical protein